MSTLETKIQEQLSLAIKERNSAKMSALRSVKTAIMEVRTSVNYKNYSEVCQAKGRVR